MYIVCTMQCYIPLSQLTEKIPQNYFLLYLLKKIHIGLTPLFGDRRGFKPAQLKTKTLNEYIPLESELAKRIAVTPRRIQATIGFNEKIIILRGVC